MLTWTPALATGVQSIDDQHKEIFRRVNVLLEASSKGQAQSKIAETIQFLGAYVVQHFTDEERVMVQNRYPRYAEHKALHVRFVEDFTALVKEYERNGATTALILSLQRRVVDWLLHHISTEDRAIGAHMAKAKAAIAV
jgi:hemerythrin